METGKCSNSSGLIGRGSDPSLRLVRIDLNSSSSESVTSRLPLLFLLQLTFPFFSSSQSNHFSRPLVLSLASSCLQPRQQRHDLQDGRSPFSFRRVPCPSFEC